MGTFYFIGDVAGICLSRKSTMPGRALNRKLLMLDKPSWRSNRLLKDDDTLQTFSWPYDTAALISEMSKLSEVQDLYEKVEQPTELAGYFTVPMHFQDAFIDSHGFLIELIDRVTVSWNNSTQEQIVILLQGQNMVNEVLSQKTANAIFKKTRERLLYMRSLYEQLKPETKDLVHRCSSFMQIGNSMLAQKKAPVLQSASTMLFQPACGFRFTSPSYSKLFSETTTIASARADSPKPTIDDIDEVTNDAIESCDELRIILCQGQSIKEPMEALRYANDFLAPQKHILERHSAFFENTLRLFPESLPDHFPSTCTADDVFDFYNELLHALDQDLLRTKLFIT